MVTLPLRRVTMNPDGTLQRAYYASSSFWPNRIFYARPIPGQGTQFVGIVTGHHGTARAGELVLFDVARGRGQADGVVNFDDMRKAVIARLVLLKGAQLVVVSSPWAARGPVYKAVQEFWGKPSDQLVLMRATGPEMCPFNWTPEAVQAVFDQPDGSYETDVLGEFIDPLSSFFTHTEIEAATRKDGRLVIERQEDVKFANNFLTFGTGPHMCVGKEYAINHLMTFLAILSTSMDWKRRLTPKSGDCMYLPTIYPADCLLTMKARKAM